MHEPTSDTPLLALEEAISIVKGPTNLALRIGRRQSTVSNWLARGRETPGWKVPADACPAIQRETGVPCERLHPGVPWEVLRQQSSEQQEAA